jgi:hypothetical protein
MGVQARLNIDTTGFVIYEYPASRHDDGVIEQDAGRSAILAQYTLMGKKAVTIPTTGTVTGTGNGTCTAVAAALGAVPIVGDWILTNTLAVAEGGVWSLTDPNGNVVATELAMTAGSGLATVFVAGGMTFTLTDGGTDFALADIFTIAVAANGKTVPFDVTAVDGSQNPDSIYMGDDITAADLVAGDVVDTPLVYEGMKFDEDKLIFDDGTTTLDTLMATGKTIREALTLVTLIPQKTDSGSAYENA